MADYAVSYSPNYFSIDDILASQDRIHCKFEVPLKGMGYLDSSSGEEDIPVGSIMELPCWLAKALHSRRQIVSAQLPNQYKEKYREILAADAKVVDLHKLGPHYYELGLHLLPLTTPTDAAALSNLLAQVLRDRLRPLMDDAQHCSVDESSSRMSKLDRLEIRLFKGGQTRLGDHSLWLRRRTHLLQTAPMVTASKKRKREDAP